jgi:hypothetical protein
VTAHEVVGAVNGDDDVSAPAVHGACSRRGVLDREGREGRVACRVVDRFKAEDGDGARGTRLFDPSAEGADLFANHLERARPLDG